MLDLVWLLLWCVPIFAGLYFVRLAHKERSQSTAVPVRADDPGSPQAARRP